MEIIIGDKVWSSWSMRPWLVLRHTGAPFTETMVRLHRLESHDEILAAGSPSGSVPALKDGELTVWDSLAICETLAERHPEAKLWPANAFMRAVARSYSAEMHSGFAAMRSKLPLDFARRLPTPKLDDETAEQIARVIAAWDHALSHHGDDGGFLFGHFTVADCMYGPVVSRFITYGIAMPKNVQAYAERMMALPAMRDWGVAAQKEVDAGIA